MTTEFLSWKCVIQQYAQVLRLKRRDEAPSVDAYCTILMYYAATLPSALQLGLVGLFGLLLAVVSLPTWPIAGIE